MYISHKESSTTKRISDTDPEDSGSVLVSLKQEDNKPRSNNTRNFINYTFGITIRKPGFKLLDFKLFNCLIFDILTPLYI